MKRILTATALVSVIASGAFAATDFDTQTINQYVPDVDVSTLSDEQVAALVGIATSEPESKKEEHMRAYLKDFVSPPTTTVVKVVPVDSPEGQAALAAAEAEPVEVNGSEFYDNQIASYLPDVDLSTLSAEQKAALIAISTESASENDKERKMRAYLMD